MSKLWQHTVELAAGEPGKHAFPSWTDDGVPRCGEDDCPHYDGKRCELTGFRPHGSCEPAIVEMARMLDEREE